MSVNILRDGHVFVDESGRTVRISYGRVVSVWDIYHPGCRETIVVRDWSIA